MPMFDMRCDVCQHKWEASKAYQEQVDCPVCQAVETKTLLGGTSFTRVKDPMDRISKSMSLPSAKKIRSYGNDKRRGGKDTT